MNNGGTSRSIEKSVGVVSSSGDFSLSVAASELAALFDSVPASLTGTLALYGTKGSPVQLGRSRAFVTRPPALLAEDGANLHMKDGSY